jgi:outer membrane beta-barrel protein
MKQLFILTFLCFLSLPSNADILKDFDSLGGNDVLMDRAKALQPEKNVSIVQNRIVDQKWRNEFSAGYTNVVGGDSYLQTQMLSLDYHLHINPYWTVGVGYFSAFNQLSSEGRFLIDQQKLVPDIDQPDTGYEVLGNFAPIYGKLNMFNMGIVQFDVYALGSYGKIKLKSGETSTYTYGAGFGLWLSQYLTTRFEIKQRYYQAQRFGGATDINTTTVGLSFGYML